MREPLIEFQAVSKAFNRKVVLDQVDLTIYPSEVTTVLGKSGVGKSVTLKLIMGLMLPDSGKILYKGQDLSRMGRKERSAMKHEVEFMFQGNALFDSLNIFENIALPLRETTRLSQAAIAKKVRNKIDFLELNGHEEKFPAEVSGGMRKRVALARALITEPQVVLFDEPTTGLDPVRKINVLSMIVDNQKKFAFTGVLVSHDVPDVLYVSNRIVLLDEARVLFQGGPMELEHHPHHVVREFLDSLLELENRVIDVKTGQELQAAWEARRAESSGDRPSVVFVLSLGNLTAVQEILGQVTAHRLLTFLAARLQEHLAGLEPLLGRQQHNTLIGVVQASRQEVDAKLESIRQTLLDIDFLKPSLNSEECVPISLSYGAVQSTGADSFHELAAQAMSRRALFFEMGCLAWAKNEDTL